MKILLLDPFHSGSHAQWARGVQAHSQHEIELVTLPGRHWKWRMHGAAVAMAERVMEFEGLPDLILTTDMMDVAAFRGLCPKAAAVPVVVYFHENQLTYPWSPNDEDTSLKRDLHYGWINYTTALAADVVVFNSDYHRNAFLEALPEFLQRYPDAVERQTVDTIEQKSGVLPLGIACDKLTKPEGQPANDKPLILWNHRWEYDKNPDDFFRLLDALIASGNDFEVAVMGQSFGKQPPIFEQARERLGDRVVQWGYADSFEEYLNWLHKADVLPVTSNQDFFGISAVEAIAAGCFPVMPNRLAFPEHVQEEHHGVVLYDTFDELVAKTEAALTAQNNPTDSLVSYVQRYDWPQLAAAYDELFEQFVAQ